MNHHLDTITRGQTRLVHITAPELPVSVVSTWYQAGSRFDPVGKEGLAHLFEHLLGAQSQKHPDKSHYFQQLEAQGIISNAFTTKEAAYYYHIQAPEQAEVSLDMLLESLREPIFQESTIEAEKEVILEESARNQQNPEEYMWEVSNRALWGEKNGLGRSFFGSNQSVQSITQDDVMAFYQQYYVGPQAVLAINYGSSQAFFEQAGAFASKEPEPALSEPFSKQDHLEIATDASHATVGINIQTVPFHDRAERLALERLAEVLAGSWSSSLIKELRLQKHLTYWVDDNMEYFADKGLMRFQFSLPASHVERALKVCQEVFEWPLDREQVAAVKQVGQTWARIQAVRPETLLWHYGYTALLAPEQLEPLQQTWERLAAVSLQELERARQQFLVPERQSVVVIA